MELTKEQWTLIDSLLPADRVRADGRGRPWTDRRQVFNGILWILRTGAPWKDLPERYGKYQTVHRRFQNWVRSGVLERGLLALAKDLRERGGLDLSECFGDGRLVPAKKGGATWARPSGARVPSSWPLQTAMVFLSQFGQNVLARLKTPS